MYSREYNVYKYFYKLKYVYACARLHINTHTLRLFYEKPSLFADSVVLITYKIYKIYSDIKKSIVLVNDKNVYCNSNEVHVVVSCRLM